MLYVQVAPCNVFVKFTEEEHLQMEARWGALIGRIDYRARVVISPNALIKNHWRLTSKAFLTLCVKTDYIHCILYVVA